MAGTQAQAHLAQFLRQRRSWRDATDAGTQRLSELCNAVLQLSFYAVEDRDTRSIEIRRRQVSHAGSYQYHFPHRIYLGCVAAPQHAGAIVERYRAAVSVLRQLETLCIELAASLDSYMTCLRSSGHLSSRAVDAAGATWHALYSCGTLFNRWPRCRCAGCGIVQHVFIRFVHQASNCFCHASGVVLRRRCLSR